MRTRSSEVLFKPFLPVTEDRFEIACNQEISNEGAAGSRILHIVMHKCSAVVGFESMFVDPQTIGTSALDIDESIWRLPLHDLAVPMHR